MKYTNCHHCEKTGVPLNDTLSIDGKVYCTACLETSFALEDQLAGKQVVREFDPTVCSNCGKDNGEIELKKLSVYPICPECDVKIRNRTLPKWVIGFFALILIIVVFSFYWNSRFYSAYQDLNRSAELAATGDFAQAAAILKGVMKEVPEVSDLKVLYAYYHGVELLQMDKGTEALQQFGYCGGKLPDDYNLSYLIIQAKLSSAFHEKDYNLFLEAAFDNLDLDTLSATSWSIVASAYSCIYAVDSTGSADSIKSLVYQYMNRAKTIDSLSAEQIEYYNLIEYRMHTREVVTREEFKEKFPNGWIKK